MNNNNNKNNSLLKNKIESNSILYKLKNLFDVKFESINKTSYTKFKSILILNSDSKKKEINEKLKKINLEKKDININTNKYTKLLLKKSNNILIVPLTPILNNKIYSRYTPNALIEWKNSVYNYNKEYLKTLTVANKNLLKIIRDYFNFETKDKMIKQKNLKTRLKKISTKKIFVSNGNIKHTNTNVICTFFVYNTERMYLKMYLNKMTDILFNPKKEMKNRPLTLYEYILKTNNIWYYNFAISHLNKTNIYLKKKIELIKLLKAISKKDESFNNLILDKLTNLKLFVPSPEFFMEKRYWSYVKYWYKYLYLYRMNNLKFSKELLDKINRMAKNVYNKNIIFKFINVRSLYSDADIFVQSIDLKFRNKINMYNKILRKSLLNAKFFSINRLLESKINKDLASVNNISFMDMNYKTTEDSLNRTISNLFPVKINNKSINISKINKLNTEKYLISKIKYNKLSGVRLEVKGRLLNKLSAYRSMYKMVSKGSLKNIDSSYKGISTKMVRGYAKSNLQYTFLSSKTKSGAFGIKGWISAK